MSYLKRLKIKVNFERDIARCETCKHIKNPFVKLTNDSKTKITNRMCGLYGFTTSLVSICDAWESDSEVLE